MPDCHFLGNKAPLIQIHGLADISVPVAHLFRLVEELEYLLQLFLSPLLLEIDRCFVPVAYHEERDLSDSDHNRHGPNHSPILGHSEIVLHLCGDLPWIVQGQPRRPYASKHIHELIEGGKGTFQLHRTELINVLGAANH